MHQAEKRVSGLKDNVEDLNQITKTIYIFLKIMEKECTGIAGHHEKTELQNCRHRGGRGIP